MIKLHRTYYLSKQSKHKRLRVKSRVIRKDVAVERGDLEMTKRLNTSTFLSGNAPARINLPVLYSSFGGASTSYFISTSHLRLASISHMRCLSLHQAIGGRRNTITSST